YWETQLSGGAGWEFTILNVGDVKIDSAPDTNLNGSNLTFTYAKSKDDYFFTSISLEETQIAPPPN
ncbi:MAG: hypothetical protein LC641_03625, partial [Spirochaeta sp.]|nr:hypothetical protein [Spirochaeta sp.]